MAFELNVVEWGKKRWSWTNRTSDSLDILDQGLWQIMC